MDRLSFHRRGRRRRHRLQVGVAGEPGAAL